MKGSFFMNIKEAKIQIINAIKAYFAKDEFGNYQIPIERQRSVFLMGPLVRKKMNMGIID